MPKTSRSKRLGGQMRLLQMQTEHSGGGSRARKNHIGMYRM